MGYCKQILFGILFYFVGVFIYSIVVEEEIPASVWNPNNIIKFPHSGHYSFITVNGARLNVLEAGPNSGPFVILLHGFPETALLSWSHQIDDLSNAGYHVVAPDQRGYNTSQKFDDLKSYHLDVLTADVIGLLDHFGVKKGFVVGHDWGAIVAWSVAINFPERVEKLMILNVPHIDVFRFYVFTHLSQFKKSWYILWFQIPYLPELLLSRGPKKMLARAGTPGRTFANDSVQLYSQAWSEKGVATGMLNWYRALWKLSWKNEPFQLRRVKPQTKIIWGKRDLALDHEMVPLSMSLCEDASVVYFEDGSHFIQHDEPEAVAQIMLDFLK